MDPFDIIHAAQNRAMNTYPLADAKEAIRANIDRAYRLAEVQLPTALEYQDLVDNITNKILTSYSYLTSQEVALVADYGVAGELGGRTKPSAAAFFGWLAAYVNSDTRREAIRNYRRSNVSDPATRLLTPSETADLNRQAGIRGLRALWAEYKTHGRILEREHLRGYVASICDAALEFDLFDVTPESWAMAREEAQKERRRLLGNVFDAALPYSDEMLTKWCLLEMCFEGQRATGRDLIVNA